jgi:hypothetical protein
MTTGLQMSPEQEALLKMQAEIRAESEAHAQAAATKARSVRENHWDAKEAEWAADRRRAAGLTPEDSRKVEYFLRWLRHVDGLRTTHPEQAVAAHGRMHAEVDRLDPPNVDGEQRLWAFAAHEANERYRFGPPAKRVVRSDFWAWSIDTRLGFNGAAPATPAPGGDSPMRTDDEDLPR